MAHAHCRACGATYLYGPATAALCRRCLAHGEINVLTAVRRKAPIERAERPVGSVETTR